MAVEGGDSSKNVFEFSKFYCLNFHNRITWSFDFKKNKNKTVKAALLSLEERHLFLGFLDSQDSHHAQMSSIIFFWNKIEKRSPIIGKNLTKTYIKVFLVVDIIKVRIFRQLKIVKTSHEMPNWRRQINKIDRQYSPQIKPHLKGRTRPKSFLILEMDSIWLNLYHIACTSLNFYEDLSYSEVLFSVFNCGYLAG